MPPYDGGTAEVMAGHLYLPLPPLPPGVPPELGELITRLTAKDPAARLANAAELAAVARRLRDILAADACHTGVASALTGADLEAGANLTPGAGGGMAAGFPDDRSVIAALPVLAAVDLPRLLSGRSPG